MKKMFRLSAAVLTITLLTMCLTGCGPSSNGGHTSAVPGPGPSAPAASPTNSEPDSGEAIDYPAKTVEIIVPFAAGGNQDVASRLIGKAMEGVLDTSIIITNKEGGGSVIGQTYAFQKPADGYTILAYSSVYTTNVISQNVPYDMESFIPVAMYSNEPEIICVPAGSDIQTYEDFITAAKDHALTTATSGHTTADHIAGEMLIAQTGISLDYVHGDGAASVAVAVGGGHTEAAICNYSSVSSMVDQGKVRVLAIMAPNRSAFCPDVPTLKELGLDLSYGKWRGFAVPKGTDDRIVTILEQAIEEALTDQNVIDSFASNGSPLEFMGSGAFTEMVMKEYEQLVPVMKNLGIG